MARQSDDAGPSDQAGRDPDQLYPDLEEYDDNQQNQQNEPTARELYELRKLELLLEIDRVAVEKIKAQNASQSPAPQLPQANSRLTDLKKDARNLSVVFKLEGSSNYDSWKEEILAGALDIDAMEILQDPQLKCPSENPLDVEMWEVRSKALFRIILGSLKSSIKESIRRVITEVDKNGAEIWIALENEYGAYRADTRDDLGNRFMNISIDSHKKDVVKYIAAFRKIVEKLKTYEEGNESIPNWLISAKFIAGLNDHQAEFIQLEKDKLRDVTNKTKLYHLELDNLMAQLTSRAQSNKKTNKEGTKAMKTDGKTSDDGKKSSTQANENTNTQADPNGSSS